MLRLLRTVKIVVLVLLKLIRGKHFVSLVPQAALKVLCGNANAICAIKIGTLEKVAKKIVLRVPREGFLKQGVPVAASALPVRHKLAVNFIHTLVSHVLQDK